MARKVNLTLPNIADLNLQVKLEGDWRRLDVLSDELGPSIQQGYDIATNKFANHLLKIIKKSLHTGIPPFGSGVHWQPLAQSTIKRYGPHNLFYLTGLYARSVGLYSYKSRVLVGLPINNRLSSQKNLTLNQLAKTLEFGSHDGRIPSRPLWGPAIKSVGGRTQLKRMILTEIRRKLNQHGIKANQVKW